MRNIAIIAGIMVIFLLGGCASGGSQTVIAEVNAEKITQQEYEHRVKLITASYKLEQRENSAEQEGGQEVPIDENILPQIQETAFNQLVMMKLTAHEAQLKGIEMTPGEIDQYLADFKSMQESNGGPEAYDQVLTDFGITEAELREELAAGLLRGKLEGKIAADAQITDAQAQEFYQAHREMFTEEAGMLISHILVDSEDEARNIIKQLQAGADFGTLAGEYSSCPSKERGGDLGVVNADTPMVEEFKDAALALPVGQITAQPVKSEFGYHVIKANGKQEERQIPFEEVKVEIISQLEDQAVGTYLDQLYQEAQIKDLRKK